MLQKAEIKYFYLYTQNNEDLITYFVYNLNMCSCKVALVLDTLVEKNPPDYLVQLICTPHSCTIKFVSDA